MDLRTNWGTRCCVYLLILMELWRSAKAVDVQAPREVDADGITVFKYKLYPYKKKQQIENMFKARADQCQQSDECLGAAASEDSIERVRCIRHCISPHCYEQIYEEDELEPGEIDVRVGSFKGCLQQEITDRHIAQRVDIDENDKAAAIDLL